MVATVAVILFHALLQFHPLWKGEVCEDMEGQRAERCAARVEEGQIYLRRVADGIALACERVEFSDCLLAAIVAEKESSLLDEDGHVGTAASICEMFVSLTRILGRTEREGDHFCPIRLKWQSRIEGLNVTRNVRILGENDRGVRLNTCCSHEWGIYQLLPSNWRAGTVTFDAISGEEVVLSRNLNERREQAGSLGVNIALGVQEIGEHVQGCNPREGDSLLRWIPAYNTGHCSAREDDSGNFVTYFEGIRSRYLTACFASLPDGSRVADHWPGCQNVPSVSEMRSER